MKPVCVAEFTTNHMGNLNLLLKMAESAKYAGADYIKMQKKNVETFYTKEKLDSEYISPYGKTYRDYRTLFEFSKEDFMRFDKKCKELDIKWFTTIQDIPSMYEMLEFDLPMYKIASCNGNNKEFLNAVHSNIDKNKTIVISIAGRTLEEIEQIVKLFDGYNLYILHCVAEYPCNVSHLRLGNISRLRKEFESDRIKIGYSGHEEGFVPSLAAIDLGAKLVERHFCQNRHSFVHHIECSLEPDEYKMMVELSKRENLKEFYEPYLPPIAYQEKFGMSEIEAEFLLKSTYGNTYLHGHNILTFQR